MTSHQLYFNKKNVLFITILILQEFRDGEKFFNELYANALSNYPSDFEIYNSNLGYYLYMLRTIVHR